MSSTNARRQNRRPEPDSGEGIDRAEIGLKSKRRELSPKSAILGTLPIAIGIGAGSDLRQ